MKLIQIQTIVEIIAENIRHISDTPNILVKAFIIFCPTGRCIKYKEYEILP